MKLDIQPLTPNRWDDLVKLFHKPGGSFPRSCWCMYYRVSGGKGLPPGPTPKDRNRKGLKALVDRGGTPGLIAYEGGEPVGWISLGPREEYAKLQKSPVMKPVDDKPVWSVVCFFVESGSRGKGVCEQLLRAAEKYAKSKGATLLEAYPMDKKKRHHASFLWFGSKSMFDRAGYEEVCRRKPERPIVRKALRK